MTPTKIKALRKKTGLTQQQFADVLGLSFVSVNRWENARSTPSGLSLVLLQLFTEALVEYSAADLAQKLRVVGPNPLEITKVLALCTLSVESRTR